MNCEEKIEAIKARINGEYDNPDLLKVGPLHPTILRDVVIILYK